MTSRPVIQLISAEPIALGPCFHSEISRKKAQFWHQRQTHEWRNRTLRDIHQNLHEVCYNAIFQDCNRHGIRLKRIENCIRIGIFKVTCTGVVATGLAIVVLQTPQIVLSHNVSGSLHVSTTVDPRNSSRTVHRCCKLFCVFKRTCNNIVKFRLVLRSLVIMDRDIIVSLEHVYSKLLILGLSPSSGCF